MTLHIPFDNSYARLPEGFFARQGPTPVKAPQTVAFNHDLADLLGITGADDPPGRGARTPPIGTPEE